MGPRLKDVEDADHAVDVSSRQMASMGPRLKDVEDSIVVFGVQPPAVGFNGATSQGRGRHESMVADMNAGQASMGPRLKDVEDAQEVLYSLGGVVWLQWGHVSRTWKTCTEVPLTVQIGCFNGATSQGRGRPPTWRE